MVQDLLDIVLLFQFIAFCIMEESSIKNIQSNQDEDIVNLESECCGEFEIDVLNDSFQNISIDGK